MTDFLKEQLEIFLIENKEEAEDCESGIGK